MTDSSVGALRRTPREMLTAIAASGSTFWILTGAICLFALLLRLPTLSSRALWLDEAYSAWFSARSLAELWREVPLYETHPPLYYTLLKGWTLLFGDSEAALRSPSVLASVATVLLVCLSGKILRAGKAGDLAALCGGVLLALNGGHIFFAQEARPYAIEALTALAAIVSALRLLQTLDPKDRESGRFGYLLPAVALALSGGLTLWMHNTAVFIVFGIWTGLGVAVLACIPANRTRNLAVIACTGFGAFAIWSPFLPHFLAQGENMRAMSFWVEASPSDLWTAWYLAAGGKPPFVPVIGAAILGLVAIWRRNAAVALAAATILLLPLYTVVAISHTIKPIYIARLFEWMAPPVSLLAGAGICMSGASKFLRVGLAGSAVVLSVISVPPQRENWRLPVSTIAEHAQPGDVVIASPTESDPGLRYYVRRMHDFPEMHVIPGDFPYRDPGRSHIGNLGAPRIVPSDAAIVRDAMLGRKRVWLVERRHLLYDPDNVVRGEILRTRKEILSREYGPITVTLFE